jgi:ABC-type nickel/cobalt efflux system permease component RcnA
MTTGPSRLCSATMPPCPTTPTIHTIRNAPLTGCLGNVGCSSCWPRTSQRTEMTARGGNEGVLLAILFYVFYHTQFVVIHLHTHTHTHIHTCTHTHTHTHAHTHTHTYTHAHIHTHTHTSTHTHTHTQTHVYGMCSSMH